VKNNARRGAEGLAGLSFGKSMGWFGQSIARNRRHNGSPGGFRDFFPI
jgi:hypothetical protein